MALEMGIRLPTAGPPQASAAFAERAEASGFEFLWMPDTPVLAGRWRDVYPHLTCAALSTRRLRLGPGVTNPITRHPVTTASAILTVDDASEGRADLVAGTGYSSAYIIGRKAATLRQMREATSLWRSIFQGEPTELGGLRIELDKPRPALPIYLAATGPKMLQLAGEIADGVLIMVGAAPGMVRWALQHVHAGLERAGRDSRSLRKILVVFGHVQDDRARAIEQMRPCAAGLYRHRFAGELLAAAGLEKPTRLPDIQHPYPDLGHAVDWRAAQRAAAFVADAAVEAYCALGSAEDVAARVRELAALDIDAIWWRDEQSYAAPTALLEALSEQVFPKLR
ncbi:MAG: LLM class flavin-dependent oxidoreductase [Gammaproteobacteria bacterium]|nr:LLM class flavin-dependent oxidoreductase [Gammaproteobacteria bacterium]